MTRLDEQQVYQWFDIFKNNNELTEIRLIGTNKTASGYFTNAETLIEAIKPYSESYNIYFTINRVNEACYGREQRDRIVIRPKNTTNDNEIICRDWVLIDIDPKRLSGVCSTAEEATKAYEKGQEVYKFLMDNGFNEPVVVFSSSGIHLYLKCALLNNDENTQLVKRFLEALAMLFSDEYVDIDTAVFNAGRISRLVGSYSCKGANTDKTRPQRKCRFLKIPDEIKVNEKEYFEKVAELYPEEETRPNASNNYSSERFDLATFISKYNINIDKVQKVAGGTKYLLKECPWNSNHKSPDSMLFQRDDGAVSFFCYHSSCQDKHWSDFRKLYEPNYQKNTNFIPNNRFKFTQQKEFEPIQKTDEKGDVWIKMSDIKKPRLDVADYIPSGIEQIDKLIIGFKRKQVSLWSGYRGCGKSSILNMLILNAAQQGYKSALWTGELDGSEVKQWLYLQASGKTYNKKSQFTDFYYTPDNICDKIDPWIDKYLFLFNNEYGENAKQLEFEIKKLKEEQDIDMVILDSLMVLDYDDLDGDRNEKQKNLMRMLTKLAKSLNIHIHLVCHPNKSGTFLRVNNISGSGHIPDYAQYIFICHRLGTDFINNSKEFLSAKTISEIVDSGCSNCIEICKCRDKGTAVDKFIKLHYEVESNRLKNSIAEHICYNWQDDEPIQQHTEYEPQQHITQFPINTDFLQQFNDAPF